MPVLKLRRREAARATDRVPDARESLGRLIALMQALAAEGRSVLAELMGEGAPADVFAHQPADDAHDAARGFRWYYHSHPRADRAAGEHGHFHLFRDETHGECVHHLLAILVDARGCPLALVAPNAWVTGESWVPAAAVLRWIEHFAVDEPAHLSRVHAWIALTLRAFAPQVRELVLARDARLDALRRSARSAVLDDRRISVLSRCEIDLMQQAAWLDRSAPDIPKTRGARS